VKITICSLLLLAGTAFADNKLQLARVGQAEPAPNIVLSYDKCDPRTDRIPQVRLKLDKRLVQVVHECGMSDQRTQLAFEAKNPDDGVQVYSSAIIAYAIPTLHDVRPSFLAVAEQSTFGKLKGGRHALLHRIDTAQRGVDVDGTRAAPDSRIDSRVDVCTFDTDGTPMCGYVVVECPEMGCKPPELIKGALWIHTKDGRKRYVIE